MEDRFEINVLERSLIDRGFFSEPDKIADHPIDGRTGGLVIACDKLEPGMKFRHRELSV